MRYMTWCIVVQTVLYLYAELKVSTWNSPARTSQKEHYGLRFTVYAVLNHLFIIEESSTSDWWHQWWRIIMVIAYDRTVVLFGDRIISIQSMSWCGAWTESQFKLHLLWRQHNMVSWDGECILCDASQWVSCDVPGQDVCSRMPRYSRVTYCPVLYNSTLSCLIYKLYTLALPTVL